MAINLPISEARNQLNRMSDELKQKQECVQVTKNGHPVLAIMPWELYESLIETIEVMMDPEVMEVLRQDIKDRREGRGNDDAIPWETVKEQLGL